MSSDRGNVPDVTRRSGRSRAVRRRDRMHRSIDATGSLAVVGTLLATGMVAGALQSANAKPSDADTVHLSVAQPSNAPVHKAPRPTKTLFKTVLVTPTPQPQAISNGSGSGQSTSGSSGSSGSSSSSGSSGSSSTWKPKKSAAPVATHSTAPAPAPQPKPSASSSGS